MEEIIKLLNKSKIRYLVIGGQALRLHGMPRFTMDWDIFIPKNDKANFDNLNKALEAYLDLPVEPIGKKGRNFVQTYQTPFGVVQFHLAPPGIPDFEKAEKDSVSIVSELGVPVKCLSTENLLLSKEKTARSKDSEDITYLRNLLLRRR